MITTKTVVMVMVTVVAMFTVTVQPTCRRRDYLHCYFHSLGRSHIHCHRRCHDHRNCHGHVVMVIFIGFDTVTIIVMHMVILMIIVMVIIMFIVSHVH